MFIFIGFVHLFVGTLQMVFSHCLVVSMTNSLNAHEPVDGAVVDLKLNDFFRFSEIHLVFVVSENGTVVVI